MTVSRIDSEGLAGVLGPITIPGLAGSEASGQGNLVTRLGPAYVLKHDSGGGKTKYVVVLGEGLGRRALMDLLYALAPYKAHGPDRFARVLDNWRLHDRAMTSSGSESLLRQHADSLKLNWQVFANHREVFIEVFEDDTENTRVLPIVTWEKSPGSARRWRFDALDQALVRTLEESIPVLRQRDGSTMRMDPLVGLIAIPYLLPKLHKNWCPWQSLVKNGKSNYVGPASVPVVALMHRRAILNSRIILAVEQLEFET